jgi:predicted nucleic acid-binding Zn ribbon protein
VWVQHNGQVASNELRSAQTLLPRLLGRLSRESGNPRGLFPVWQRVAGEPIARSARPVAIEAGVLVIEVPDRNWAAELTRREPELRERLCAEVGGWITRLDFRVARA